MTAYIQQIVLITPDLSPSGSTALQPLDMTSIAAAKTAFGASSVAVRMMRVLAAVGIAVNVRIVGTTLANVSDMMPAWIYQR